MDWLQWTPDTPAPAQQTLLPPTDWSKATYTYDPVGRRIQKKIDPCDPEDQPWIQTYVYDGDQVIAEYDNAGALQRKYIHGPGMDRPVAMIETTGQIAKTYFYHIDGLGSVIALSDPNGDPCQTYEYAIYGQVSAQDPNFTNPYLFTGQRFDVETGLYYLLSPTLLDPALLRLFPDYSTTPT